MTWTGEALLRLAKERCKTCIFGEQSPLRPGRFAELRAAWEERGGETFQVCHQWGAWDEDDPQQDGRPEGPPVVCRGFYEVMYQGRGIPVAAIQIAERLGGLEEVEVSDG